MSEAFRCDGCHEFHGGRPQFAVAVAYPRVFEPDMPEFCSPSCLVRYLRDRYDDALAGEWRGMVDHAAADDVDLALLQALSAGLDPVDIIQRLDHAVTVEEAHQRGRLAAAAEFAAAAQQQPAPRRRWWERRRT